MYRAVDLSSRSRVCVRQPWYSTDEIESEDVSVVAWFHQGDEWWGMCISVVNMKAFRFQLGPPLS
jgi:hypothetical protein